MPETELMRFDFNVMVTKAWVVKSKDTNVPDKYYVKAIASDTAIDSHGERFSENAIDGMVNCIKTNSPATVILLPTHWDTFEIGKVTNALKIDSQEFKDLKSLEVDIELDMEYPQAKSLYKEVEGGTPQKQLSVGGYLNPKSEKPYFWEKKEFTAEDGSTTYDYVLVLDDMILDHIAVTRKNQAANPRTSFLEAVAKSKILKPETKEVKPMSQAEKDAQSLMKNLTDGITNFFKSKDAGEVQIKDAQDSITKALAAVKALGDNVPTEITELLKGLTPEPVAPAAPVVKAEDVTPPATPAVTKTEDVTPPATAATPEVVDMEKFKSDILSATQVQTKEAFTSFAKELGPVLGGAIQTAFKSLQDKIDSIEKNMGGTTAIAGQEGLTTTPAKTKSVEEEDDDMWSGMFKNAIPAGVLDERRQFGGESGEE